MDILITTDIPNLIFGFSGVAENKDHVGTAFKLSDKMWKAIKTQGIKNKGKNIWVYEDGNRVFAGVELENDEGQHIPELERKEIAPKKYAYYKHIGPYSLISEAGQKMKAQLSQQGHEVTLPYIEVYGHWDNDENKLETELLMCLK